MQRQGSRRHRSSSQRPRTSSGESSQSHHVQSPSTSTTSSIASAAAAASYSYQYGQSNAVPPARSSSQARHSAAAGRSINQSSTFTARDQHREAGYNTLGSPPVSYNSGSRPSTRDGDRESRLRQRSPNPWPARQSSQGAIADTPQSNHSSRQSSRPPSSKYPVVSSQPLYPGPGHGSTFYEPELDYRPHSSRATSLTREQQRSHQSRGVSSNRAPPASPTSARTPSTVRSSAAGRQTGDPSSNRYSQETTSSRAPSVNRHSSKSAGSRRPSIISGQGIPVVEDRGRSREPAKVVVGASFLNLDDDMDDDEDAIPILQRPSHDAPTRPMPSVYTSGRTLDSLVDRLLSRPITKADGAFPNTFLCLYRKFSTPSLLLRNLIARFKGLGRDDLGDLTRIDARLRHLSILEKWVSQHPGDVSPKELQVELQRFLSDLHKIPHYAANALQISRCLDTRTTDDDALWAKPGSSAPKPGTRPSSKQGPVPRSPTQPNQPEAEGEEEQVSGSSRTSSGLHTLDGSHRSSHTSMDDIAGGHVHRQMMRKEQWKSFMLLPERAIADQLTLMDWSFLSKIKARDLIRHVSLSPEQRQRTRNNENVSGMINHFNHVALWVGHMILFRDKPKHRALALEKFMKIAKKLRKSNNYSSLGAIIAGINGNAVHRLSHTRELVDPQVAKEYQKWDILMGTQKGYSAYRLAFENSPKERIPFLPVHRRDLVAAEEGNPTFLDDEKTQINWKKFEILGTILAGITRCQEFPYRELAPSYEVQALLQRTAFATSEDELWERSIRLEEPNGTPIESKKKFAWLTR